MARPSGVDKLTTAEQRMIERELLRPDLNLSALAVKLRATLGLARAPSRSALGRRREMLRAEERAERAERAEQQKAAAGDGPPLALRDEFEVWLERAKLDSAESVLMFMRWVCWRMEKLADAAEASGDLRTSVAAIDRLGSKVIDCFAKHFNVVRDGSITVNVHQEKVLALFEGLDDDELCAIVDAAIAQGRALRA